MYDTGVVYLVGIWGGDPGLITRRGKEVLDRADVVVFDVSLSEEMLEVFPPSCEKVRVASEDVNISSILVSRAEQGKIVVRLCGDDPYNFGQCVNEAKILTREGIPFEVIPGLSAALAAPTYAGIPLSVGKDQASFSILNYPLASSQSLADTPYCSLAKEGYALVFLLSAKSVKSLFSDLIKGGISRDTPLTIINQGGSPSQRVIETVLGSIPSSKHWKTFGEKIVIILGNVNRHRWELNWFEGLPLHGRRILVTRPREQADGLARLLVEVGAEPIIAPTIQISAPDDWRPLDKAVRELESYHWVIFTSANGVRFFAERLIHCGRDPRAFAPFAKIMAIGPATAQALKDILRLRADAVPKSYVAEGILEMLPEEKVTGKRILIPRAAVAREILPNELSRRGAEVNLVTAYQTLPAEMEEVERLREDLQEKRVEMVTFTSSSTVRNFADMLGTDFLKNAMENVAIASIGPVTSKTVREVGLNPHVEAEVSTARGLARSIVDYYRFSPAVDWREPPSWGSDQ